jgi:hypothetical protein
LIVRLKIVCERLAGMAEALAKHYSPGPAPPEMKRATDWELFDFDSKLGTASHFVQFLPLRLGEKLLVPKLAGRWNGVSNSSVQMPPSPHFLK